MLVIQWQARMVVKRRSAMGDLNGFQTLRNTQLIADLKWYWLLKSAAEQAVTTAKIQHHQEFIFYNFKQHFLPWQVQPLLHPRHWLCHASQRPWPSSPARPVISPTLEYFSSICNEEFQHQPIPSPPHILGPIHKIIKIITVVKLSVEKIKSSKEIGPDNIPAEVLKIFGDRGASFLAKPLQPHCGWEQASPGLNK